MDGVVKLKAGEYKGCGMSLRVTETKEGCLVSVEPKGGVILSWSFSKEGVFRELGALSPASDLARGTPVSLLACRHVGEDFKGQVLLYAPRGSRLGWICCPDCVREMLDGESIHVITAETVSHILKGCDTMTVMTDEEGGAEG